jgi:hypothetical protein
MLKGDKGPVRAAEPERNVLERTRWIRGRVSRVIIGLDICVRKWSVQACDYGLNGEFGDVGQSIWEDVTSSDVDAFLEEIVLKNDETVVHGSCIVDDIFPVVQHLLYRCKTSMYVIVCEMTVVRSTVVYWT